MITKKDIRPGILLRVLSDHLGTPLHAIATVETIETSRTGSWLCTHRYNNKRVTNGRYLYRSHLWESELGCVEIVTDLNGIVEPPSRRSHSPFKPVIFDAQLGQPFQFDEEKSG